MSKYTGGNTVDWNESREIEGRGSLMRLMLERHRDRVESVTQMTSAGQLYRRFVFPKPVTDARRKLLKALDRMPRRETP